MAKRKRRLIKSKAKKWTFSYGQRRIQVILDKFLIFNFIKNLHGRFWGVIGLVGLVSGFLVCFLIRPELLTPTTAFSDFGDSVKTAPYFAFACFFAAYGLWRWRNYLSRTLKRAQPVTTFITLTIVGLYLVALMPSSWKPWPYRMHLFGVTLMSVSIALTVVFDILLSKTRKNQQTQLNRLLKIICFGLIIIGSWLALGSLYFIAWYRVPLLGESLIILGYTIWVVLKTYQGEEPRSRLSKIINKFILIN